jgi:Outer membrane protein beta-barrel domain
MKKKLAALALAFATTLPLSAQNWSVGVGSGPFVFGDFLERRVRIGTGDGPSGEQTLVLSAGTRAGLVADLERRINDRWAVRLEGTFTKAPLRLHQAGASGDGTEISAGDLDVATFVLPIVFRINPKGTFRFHVMGGPAYAIYRAEGPDGGAAAFQETQGRFGVAFGGGVGWWLSERFAVEGNIADITTSSPFDEDDFPAAARVDVPRPHNVHTSVGIRYRF